MNMIENHVEQIALSATTIADLPLVILKLLYCSILTEVSFPRPKIFTNALLRQHDITTLIRDTEAHERALFTVTPHDPVSFEARTRKSGFYNANGDPLDVNGPALAGLKPTSAVGKILGGDLAAQIRRGGRSLAKKNKGDIDVETLLSGAEKLCGI